ncbi:MAG: hypothetical protein WBJ83_10275 [Thermacetogeniaceae bacterium]|nr:hypothetical protein [Syntrophomonadaceae bacterium]
MSSHVLNELEIAPISTEELNKLQEAEKAINNMGGGNEEIYLLALKRRGQK